MKVRNATNKEVTVAIEKTWHASKGWFAFGGSTVVYIFEPGRIRLDADLIEQTGLGRETLVRLGTRMGEIL